MELKSIPEQRRTAREHILILVHDKFLRDREEIQELRISRDTSRSVLSNYLMMYGVVLSSNFSAMFNWRCFIASISFCVPLLWNKGFGEATIATQPML